jgi:hypothetical protein
VYAQLGQQPLVRTTATSLEPRRGTLSCLSARPPDLADAAITRPQVVSMFLSIVPFLHSKRTAAARSLVSRYGRLNVLSGFQRRYLTRVGLSVDIVYPWTEARRSSDSRKVRPPGRENKVKPCPPALPATVLAGGSCSSTVMLNFGDASFKRRVEVHTAPRVPCGTRIVCAASHIMP